MGRMLSQGQGDRFDRWVEVVSVIVLSLATVMTAWCGYQAARKSGEQTRAYSQATASRIMAAQKAGEAQFYDVVNGGLFAEYAAALLEDDRSLSQGLYRRFSPELKAATDAWLATDPLENPSAPLSPFAMTEYRLAQRAASQQLGQRAAQHCAEANRHDEQSDEYVLLTVIFAMALFFCGISGKFRWRLLDLTTRVLGTIVLAGGTWRLLEMPVI
jgi:hypothetical protein